ncbi:parathyroid hormone 4-like [Pelobates fuscus]|uniref:parathyroid hormone 4-like n=1 Tax=Pelobates fuscus TaxID=191477 RepID=UPI002FE4B756
MLLSQKYLQVVAFLGIVCFSCIIASENQESERSVAEAQLMHDKGKTIEEINRQRWLHGLLGSIHNPGRREVSSLRNFHRDVLGIKEDHQRINILKNIRNLQYRDAVIAHSKTMFE